MNKGDIRYLKLQESISIEDKMKNVIYNIVREWYICYVIFVFFIYISNDYVHIMNIFNTVNIKMCGVESQITFWNH